MYMFIVLSDYKNTNKSRAIQKYFEIEAKSIYGVMINLGSYR